MIWIALIFILIGIAFGTIESRDNSTDAVSVFFMAVGVTLFIVWMFK